jgi:hypothetical protein
MSDHEDYARIHDAQSQRTRREMWVILAIVVVVIVGGLIWRAVAHVPAKPQKNWGPNNELTTGADMAPAAAAGVHAAPAPAGP